MQVFNYPKERMFAFTDAVFSIAITILVLEIAVPTRDVVRELGMSVAFQELIPSFIGFFVSFVVIAMYWKFYLVYSRYINSFDNRLFWYNTFMLLFIALLPFSTAFFVDGVLNIIPYSFYCANLVLLSLMVYIMVRLVLKRAKLKVDQITIEWLRFRAFTTLLVWIVAFALSFSYPVMARVCIILIFVLQGIGKLYYNRKSRKKTMLE